MEDGEWRMEDSEQGIDGLGGRGVRELGGWIVEWVEAGGREPAQGAKKKESDRGRSMTRRSRPRLILFAIPGPSLAFAVPISALQSP